MYIVPREFFNRLKDSRGMLGIDG